MSKIGATSLNQLFDNQGPKKSKSNYHGSYKGNSNYEHDNNYNSNYDYSNNYDNNYDYNNNFDGYDNDDYYNNNEESPQTTQKNYQPTSSSIQITRKIKDPDMEKIHQLLINMKIESKEQYNAIKEQNNEQSNAINLLKEQNIALKEIVESLSNKLIKKKNDDTFKTEIIHKGKNLIDVHACSVSKYITKLMEILFTTEELKNGYIKADVSTSKRTNVFD